MREVLCEESARACLEYFNHVRGEARACNTVDIPDLIEIFDRKITTRTGATEIISESETAISASSVSTGLENVTLTLLDSSTGETPNKSGLNWGQRPGRNRNQAYINIPSIIGRSGFFPDRYIVFTVVTDDGKELICVRAQDNGKGIETPLNNSQMGEYFRYRLGLASGAFVTKDDLLRYGRTDVTFYKIDEENYYMDFSVS